MPQAPEQLISLSLSYWLNSAKKTDPKTCRLNQNFSLTTIQDQICNCTHHLCIPGLCTMSNGPLAMCGMGYRKLILWTINVIYMCNIYLGTWCKCQYDCGEEYLHWTSLYMAIITTSQAKEGIMQSIKTKKKRKSFYSSQMINNLSQFSFPFQSWYLIHSLAEI